MDFLTRKRDEKFIKHRFTPQKISKERLERMDFSFSEWSLVKEKRSPTSFEVNRKVKIKNFYANEQKKIIKIHRSFDYRNEYQKEVKQINNHIKQIVNTQGLGQHKLLQKELIIRNISGMIKYEDPQPINITPYFSKAQSKLKFPRDVFSSQHKKYRL